MRFVFSIFLNGVCGFSLIFSLPERERERELVSFKLLIHKRFKDAYIKYMTCSPLRKYIYIYISGFAVRWLVLFALRLFYYICLFSWSHYIYSDPAMKYS